MGFFAMYFLHGALLAGPVDRSGFPVVIETDWETRTSIGDQSQRMDLIGTDRIRVTTVFFDGNGHPDADTGFKDLRLDPQGRISNDCDGRDCDYRQAGREYRYGSNGQISRQIRYSNGKARDTVDFIFRDGHNVGTADSQFTLTWSGDYLTAKRIASESLLLTSNYSYNAAHDTITHRVHNPIGDPNDGVEVYALAGGRPVSRIESDSTGLFSRRTFRYSVATAMGIPPPRRTPLVSHQDVDPLGRIWSSKSGLRRFHPNK